MNKTTTFIILEGLLDEALAFEPSRVYEAPRAPLSYRDQKGNTPVVVHLLDGAGQVLLSATPAIRYPQGCADVPAHPGVGLLRVALARPDTARKLVVAVHGQPIFSQAVGARAPRIGDFKVEVKGGKPVARIHLDTGKVEPDHVDFFLVDADGRRLPAAVIFGKSTAKLDLSPYAGRGEGRLMVRVTRRARSAVAWSDDFALPAVDVHGRILAPRDGDQWPAGHPGSLIANLADQNGRPLAWQGERLAWFVDGKIRPDHDPIAPCDALDPGQHTIELRYKDGSGQTAVLDSVAITVRPASDAQQAYDKLVASYLASRPLGVGVAVAAFPPDAVATA